MNKPITVEDWVAMFREIGLDEAQMEKWHRLFEARHPTDHQKFLEWLGLKPEEISRIRSKSR
jgi:hypothetical protein